MPGEEEILKYTLDVSDVEAKGQRLQELLDQIKAKRAAKEDTSELEAQVGKEIDGLSKVVGKEKEAAGATQELVQQKERLGATMRVLGSSSSALVGDLGGVVELMMQGGKQAIMFAGGLAGITLGVAAVRRLKEEWEAAAKAVDDYNQANLERKVAAIESGAGLGEQLRGFGAIGRFDEAARMATSLTRQWGFAPEQAQGAAVLGTVGGLSVEQAGILSMAMAEGAQVSTPEQAAALFKDMPPDAMARWRADLDKLAGTPVYESRKRLAHVPGAVGVGARLTTVEVLFQAMRDLDVLPAGVTTLADLQRHIEEARKTVEEVPPREYMLEAFKKGKPLGCTGGLLGHLTKSPRELAEARRLLSLLEQTPSGGMPADIEYTPEAEGGRSPTQIFIQQYNRTTAGTINNMADRKTRSFDPSWGVTPGDGSSIRTNHGM